MHPKSVRSMGLARSAGLQQCDNETEMPETRSIMRTALLLIVGLVPGVISGQTTSAPVRTIRIAGRVVDSTGATIPRAPVTLRSARLGDTAATTQTDHSGKFTFAAAPASRYELLIQTPPETESTWAFFGNAR